MALLSPCPSARCPLHSRSWPWGVCAGSAMGSHLHSQASAPTATKFDYSAPKNNAFPSCHPNPDISGLFKQPYAPGAPSLYIQSTCTGSMGGLGLLEPEPDSFQSLFCRGSCAQHHHSTPNRDFSFKSPVPKGSQLQNHPGGTHLPEAAHPPCTPHASHGRDARNINFHLIMQPGNNHWRNCKHLSMSMGSGTRVSLARG